MPMLIQKCPQCAEFSHAGLSGEPMICWNCGSIVPIYGAPTWDQTISNWIDRQIADPESLLPLAVPLALFLILFFLEVTAQR